MADYQNLVITQLASASVNVPRATIALQVCDSQSGAVLHDLTGANAVSFPAILSTLTAQQRLDLLMLIIDFMVRVKFPDIP